ncbi:Fc receptor-like protein 3 isoform X1 [Pelobates fuscus]|uniref:Fc receptor-like protein 3 isoform X1 n=1 Tax=Pelobates fuscus TaxID=191477 RepID=UPI002FE45F35
MSLLLLMILFSDGLNCSGATVKPVVSFSPNVGKIFIKESITLYCKVDSTYRQSQRYSWYKDNKFIKNSQSFITTNSARSEHSGDYSCKFADSDMSDSLRLVVSDGYVILQSPATPVYEGDNLTLRCRHRKGTPETTTFYKGGNILSLQTDYLNLESVDKTATGTYSCEKYIAFTFSKEKYEDSTYITVRDLFSDPEIKASQSNQLIKGSAMTLTCDTRLAPPRADTQLQFIFYKNEQKLQEFGKSNQYQVNSVQPHDSGDYTCEVRTATGNVKKMSREIQIEIQSLPPANVMVSLKPPKDMIMEGERLEVTCSVDIRPETFEFCWCKQDAESCDGKQSSNSQQVQFAVDPVLESYSGIYYCLLISNKFQTSIRSESVRISVNVPVTDAQIRADRDILEMETGNNVTFTCSVERGTSPSFKWKHNEVQVNNVSGLYQIQDSGKILYIDNVQAQHGGTYQCWASNQFSTNIFFTVKSNILTITVSERISGILAYSITLFVLVLLLIIAILLLKYRHKLPIPCGKRHQPETTAGVAHSKPHVRITQRPRNESSDEDQLDYQNIPSRHINVEDNVSYSYLDICSMPRNTLTPRNDENIVKYAAVKCAHTTNDEQNSYEDMANHSPEIYENFNSK